MQPFINTSNYARLYHAIEAFYVRAAKGMLSRIAKASFQYGPLVASIIPRKFPAVLPDEILANSKLNQKGNKDANL